MNVTKQYMHEKVTENWNDFPWKVDYIIHMLFSKNDNIYDIHLKQKNGFYTVIFVNNMNAENEKFECNTFTIEKNELLDYLKIDQAEYNDFVTFLYHTEIFDEQYRFRVQKTPLANGDLIVLRFLKQSDDINFNGFNHKLENYGLYNDLNENLPQQHAISEKKIKI